MKLRVLALALGLLFVTSCGADDSAEEAEATTSLAATETNSAPTSTTETATEESGSSCREVVHVMGTACVPTEPVRIVALDPLTVLPTLLALGVPVVATVSTYEFGEPFVDYLDPASTAGIEIIGAFSAEPNLEAVAAADPDLIIGSVSRLADHYDTLSEIAPTVVTGYAFYEADWRKEITLTAEAVGRVEMAETLLADLDEHIAEVHTILGEGETTPSLSRVDVWQGTPLYYQFECVWFGGLLTGAGVEQPASQVTECDQGDVDTTIGYLSMETIDLLEADAIVAYQQQASAEDEGADPTTALAESPLWASLTAVENDRVFVLGDAWGLGGSIQAAHRILDDMVDVVFVSHE